MAEEGEQPSVRDRVRAWCIKNSHKCLSIEWITLGVLVTVLHPVINENRWAFSCFAIVYFGVRLPWRGSWPWHPPKRGWW